MDSNSEVAGRKRPNGWHFLRQRQRGLWTRHFLRRRLRTPPRLRLPALADHPI